MELLKDYSALVLSLQNECKHEDFELDFQENLPQYLDDAEKLVKCSVKSVITDYDINMGSVNIYGKSLIYVTYISSSGLLLSDIFEEDFSKSLDLKEGSDISFADLSLVTRYSSSRLINQRRIDIHTALTVKLTAYSKNSVTRLTNCKNAFVKEKTVQSLTCNACALSSAEFDESFSLQGESELENILSVFSSCYCSEYKLVKEKMLVKINATAAVVYKNTDGSVNKFVHNFTTSRIIDVPQVDENATALISTEISSLYLKTKTDSSNKLNVLELIGRVSIKYRLLSVSENTFITDSYMPHYNSVNSFSQLTLNSAPSEISDKVSAQLSFDNDKSITEIIDMNTELQSVRIEKSRLCFKVLLSYLYYDDESELMSFEKTQDYSLTLNDNELDGVCSVQLISFDYNLDSDKKVTVKLNFEYCAFLYSSENISFITDIEENGKKNLSDRAQLTLYFAKQGEELWDIAKEFSSDAELIASENNIGDSVISSPSIILIPEM
ncbi:MAG: hypothetical protein J5964_00425 [Eubacterium sp.]|nr:hypothetical protein [Eubacterium sp.]